MPAVLAASIPAAGFFAAFTAAVKGWLPSTVLS